MKLFPNGLKGVVYLTKKRWKAELSQQEWQKERGLTEWEVYSYGAESFPLQIKSEYIKILFWILDSNHLEE